MEANLSQKRSSILILIIVLLIFSACKSESKDSKAELEKPKGDTASMVIKRIQVMDLDYFLDKPVIELIDSIGIQYRQIIPEEEPPYHVSGSFISYCDSFFIQLKNDSLEYLPGFLEPNAWNEEVYLKERISGIEVYKQGEKILETYE